MITKNSHAGQLYDTTQLENPLKRANLNLESIHIPKIKFKSKCVVCGKAHTTYNENLLRPTIGNRNTHQLTFRQIFVHAKELNKCHI